MGHPEVQCFFHRCRRHPAENQCILHRLTVCMCVTSRERCGGCLVKCFVLNNFEIIIIQSIIVYEINFLPNQMVHITIMSKHKLYSPIWGFLRMGGTQK